MVANCMSYKIGLVNENPLPQPARLCYDGSVKQDFAEQRRSRTAETDPPGERRAEAGTAAGAPDYARKPASTREIPRALALRE